MLGEPQRRVWIASEDPAAFRRTAACHRTSDGTAPPTTAPASPSQPPLPFSHTDIWAPETGQRCPAAAWVRETGHERRHPRGPGYSDKPMDRRTDGGDAPALMAVS